MNFNDETVLITGGASGMGASHVRSFHALGANVVIADIASKLGQELSEELGDRAFYVRLDVADETSWHNAVVATNATFGAISVLVNNAGIIGIEALVAGNSALFRKMLDINLTGAYLGIAAVIDDMKSRGGGAIVNIASTAAVQGYPLATAYCASKWGVLGLTKAAALELAHDNIRVNAVLPGPVQTPMTAPHDLSAVLAVQPISRAAQPEEISRMVTFLAHRDSGYITGGGILGGWWQYFGSTS